MDKRRIFAEALMQTPDQQATGTVTYRVYIDEAFRNVDGLKEWSYLSPEQLQQLVEQIYWQQKQLKKV